ncbi:MAG: Mov34/MPN/PAD-1 family protein [Oscillospiraceae bacterium]|nr:Mov34/MPN/PAD-1 family protein [Oscillospiraceae bacterium]
MPKQVIFSCRAFTSLLAETKEKIKTETGGVFLGVMRDDIWYVVEAIDPGPNSIFQTSYFEYDTDYVRHLANKVNRLYGDRLDVLGLWHRHPGSMDTFSHTDDKTITEFAKLNNGGTISAIVNIDPKFRFTLYYAKLKPFRYKKIKYEVDDSKIPDEIKNIVSHNEIEEQINSMYSKKHRNKSKIIQKTDEIKKALEKHFEITKFETNKKISWLKNTEEELDFLIENYIVDESIFCEDNGIPYIFDCSEENRAELIIGTEDSDMRFTFYMVKIKNENNNEDDNENENEKQPCFIYKEKLYKYSGNLLKTAMLKDNV